VRQSGSPGEFPHALGIYARAGYPAPMDTTTPPSFLGLGLDPRLEQAVADLGYDEPTPIQLATLKPLLEGKDLIGQARTGSGKTAAFGLPLLQRIANGGNKPRALVLAPTRELAMQVSEAIRTLSTHMPDVRGVTVYGGAPYEKQLRALDRGVSVVIGTPGRIIDLVERGALDLSAIEMLVLDEGDEMLRMGFIDAVEFVLERLPEERQIVLFSATMPDRIRHIAQRHMRSPVHVQVEEEELSVGHIQQYWMNVPQRHKLDAIERVLAGVKRDTTLVFARTRASCAETADALARRGIAVDALHGDLNQAARERVLQRLRSRSLEVVIATDVASRGIDVEHITHVINLDLPLDTETYVHRIGRTGRAGREGTAITFVTPAERRRIRFLQRDLGLRMEEMDVPSDANISKMRRANLLGDLSATLAADDFQVAVDWVNEIIEEHDIDPVRLAAATLFRLAAAQGTPLTAPAEAAQPQWSVPFDERPAPDENEDPNEVELFFSVGRNRGVRAGDFVGAIANDLGVPGNRIGRVSIFDNKTFVGLPRYIAEQVLREHSSVDIRGVPTHMTLAHPRQNITPHATGPRPASAEHGNFAPDRGGPRAFKPGGNGPTKGAWARKGQRHK